MVVWYDSKRCGEITESTTKIGEFRLSIHHYIGYPKEQWFASCLMFNRKKLASPVLSQAKTQAVAILQVILQDAIDEIVG